MDEYCVLLGLHHLANSILYKTIVAKTHLAYWAQVKLSLWGKLVYGVQTLPLRAWRVIGAGFCGAVAAAKSGPGPTWASCGVGPLVRALRRVLASTWRRVNADFVVRQSRLLFLKIPMKGLDAEIRGHTAALAAELDEHHRMLGVFVNSLPVSRGTLAQIVPQSGVPAGGAVGGQLDFIAQFVAGESRASLAAPPGAVARYWPLLLVAAQYGPALSLNAWQNRAAIAAWVRRTFVDTAAGFWRNWVVKPVGDMLSILRNDEAMALALKQSLRADLDSLERMVLAYVADTHVDVAPADVRAAVRLGDLTMVMARYEDELRTPYRALLGGLLVRALLIQVQKTKVDGDLAITGIDKLLKLQQLLLGVLSVLPSLFILYQAQRALFKDAALTQSFVDRRVDCLKSLNLISRLLNREQAADKYVADGKLFVEVVNLSLLAHQIIPAALRDEFVGDLNLLALACSDDSIDVRAAAGRVWNMYAPYFRK
ncbi:NCA2-domain-containing protein [Metschnikowia bicuspidata var. bicuspidata NRRL YB-4993]|uniref:NCA2-domain-containing protein n=1 Tax=Metschnikowia bicuspidata var. bicuspidata NRRL YB-4993 TaxID=869754 RepID=A0A1A0H5I5_9ASCO|nr:NCA2-domain-containing protein [Metschnikowia bicuspidata var. bicuspidata NRRL YB-4993]OBA19178.1 NCA2-domain-containing protein [Metschnikowia bicuspidata var. bicuspidata NRRL YB-4993]